MKWTVILLVTLGLLAAVSASVLFGALRGLPSDDISKNRSSSKVEVILATKEMPAMSVLTQDDMVVKTVSSKEDMPEGYISDTVQAVGRILVVAVTPNQILTENCFVKDGDRARLAAAIPYGMRAISISFPNSAVGGGLLYPGCVIDILASFRLPSKNQARGRAISTTLLQGIQILAVENVSIMMMKDQKEKEHAENAAYSGNKKLMITLMVNPRQAEALQLAREYGSVSIAMRNPLDTNPVDSDSTVLNEGDLAKSSSLMTPTVLSPEKKIALLKEMSKSSNILGNVEHNPLSDLDYEPELPMEQWNVTVIRGADVQIQKLDNPEETSSASDI